jgi:60 kDa SS-A/Ro ribonucleoprotein
MKNYSESIKSTPQTCPIFGRTDMVKNNAGGYVFKVSDKEQLERFLLLGSEGGTYYATEQKLTKDNAETIIKLITTSGESVVNTVVDFAVNNKAPKADAGIFVLALCSSFGNAATKKAAYSAVTQVCRTSTQLFMFLANIQQLRGWSRGLRNAVANWYNSKESDRLAYQIIKYRNRAGFTHKDALRLAHPKAKNDSHNLIFGYITGKKAAEETKQKLIINFEKAQKASESELISLIGDNSLTWEMVPTEMLNNTNILTALLDSMPVIALVRNLNRFSYNGLTESNNQVVKTICSKLRDKELVKASGIHPINVVNAMRTYASGHGDKGSKYWTPNQRILDAMSDMYESAVLGVKATNKDILVMTDVSGSMKNSVSGMSMSASEIAQVLGVTILKTEPNAEMYNFDTKISTSRFGKRSSIDEVLRYAPAGGGTDCALAFQQALDLKKKLDAIIILTDNETWAGKKHGLVLLNEYRRKYNKDVKVIEIALVSNPYSQFPSDEKNLLRVVGFDNSVIDLINKFIS